MKAFLERWSPWLALGACLLTTLAVLWFTEPSPAAPVFAAPHAQAPVFSGEEIPLRAYLPDEPAWHGALGLWKTHDGLDLACETVCALQDGTVSSVENDPYWGVSVTIASGEETVIYRSLAAAQVKPGQYIRAGAPLGPAAAAPCEAELGPHAHIEYSVGDPSALLKGG
ncbi:MAG: peptidoglycan DD-metalloendopeptidase family protein [Clostridia bacterium]|nr:peptidoglycan DD-metalloendopeptidase family protein [Clostridia bacterium]